MTPEQGDRHPSCLLDVECVLCRCKLSGQEHLVISNGDLSGTSNVLLEIQHGNVFADLVNLQTSSSSRLKDSLNLLATHTASLVIYCSGGLLAAAPP